MDIKTSLILAWRSFWVLKKHRPEPGWARLLISTGIGLAVSAVLLIGMAAVAGQTLNLRWWQGNIVPNLLISLSVSYTIHALYRSIERLLPEALIQRISGWRNWRSGLFFTSVAIAGTLLGGAIGLGLIGGVFDVDAWNALTARPGALGYFVLIALVLNALNWLWWKLRWRQQALQLQATESRLRLLQAQIEPHFLFNTLANVQSLIDHDTAKAKAMLEAFTDYLRASLGLLRHADSTLTAELEMAQSYLLLLQTRMGERLAFTLDASAEARSAVLPPLLLQPLIENAIHHGLEPQVAGGTVRIAATVAGGVLRVVIDDDGRGLDAPRRAGLPGRPGTGTGTGMALDNIRTRLQTRYGDAAMLQLTPLPVGTRATLRLPFTPSVA